MRLFSIISTSLALTSLDSWCRGASLKTAVWQSLPAGANKACSTSLAERGCSHRTAGPTRNHKVWMPVSAVTNSADWNDQSLCRNGWNDRDADVLCRRRWDAWRWNYCGHVLPWPQKIIVLRFAMALFVCKNNKESSLKSIFYHFLVELQSRSFRIL